MTNETLNLEKDETHQNEETHEHSFDITNPYMNQFLREKKIIKKNENYMVRNRRKKTSVEASPSTTIVVLSKDNSKNLDPFKGGKINNFQIDKG